MNANDSLSWWGGEWGWTQHADVCSLQKVLLILLKHGTTAPQLSSAAQFTHLGHVWTELLAGKFLQTCGPAAIRSRIFYLRVCYQNTQVRVFTYVET
jgi:hypothetical protein